ncbi:MAG: xanthine dehydrogenase family protein subunit M [Desulfatiglandaceae bacterium]
MKSFEYIRPVSLNEACRLLGTRNSSNYILAGGTDLLVRIKKDDILPERVISLRDIPNLSEVRTDSNGLFIGAMTTFSTIVGHRGIMRSFPAIAEAAQQIGSAQVRNRATIGGNLCNGAPSADMVPALLVHGASLVITSENKDRTMPLQDFFKGPGQTHLETGEILKEIYLPISQPCFSTYLKAYRSKMDIALVGVGLFLGFKPGRRNCSKIRIALGAVAPTPLLLNNLEEIISGSGLDDITIDKIVHYVSGQASPITDVRTTASYRYELIRVLTQRALLAARKSYNQGVSE